MLKKDIYKQIIKLLRNKGEHNMVYDIIIVGAGIIGLSTGMEFKKKFPNKSIMILEKEKEVALHQTGRNSGVIHSGIYYKPGSLKANLAKRGRFLLKEFCENNNIKFESCGKLIVATNTYELNLLEKLYENGKKNNIKMRMLTQKEVNKREPYVNGLAGIEVLDTGIVNYRDVSKKFADIFQKLNGEIKFNTELIDISHNNDHFIKLDTSNGSLKSKYVVNCSGLMVDKVSKMSGIITDIRIIPFRGEYYELSNKKKYLVKNLIYPVPNPELPFLGVHFTRTIDGKILIGPNALLSFKREGYKKSDFSISDTLSTVLFPGFWKLATKNLKYGIQEVYHSYNKASFLKSINNFIPEIEKKDLVPYKHGIRAQAVNNDGELIDDFVIISNNNVINVCNAPSPAATASIGIGEEIVRQSLESWDL